MPAGNAVSVGFLFLLVPPDVFGRVLNSCFNVFGVFLGGGFGVGFSSLLFFCSCWMILKVFWAFLVNGFGILFRGFAGFRRFPYVSQISFGSSNFGWSKWAFHILYLTGPTGVVLDISYTHIGSHWFTSKPALGRSKPGFSALRIKTVANDSEAKRLRSTSTLEAS